MHSLVLVSLIYLGVLVGGLATVLAGTILGMQATDRMFEHDLLNVVQYQDERSVNILGIFIFAKDVLCVAALAASIKLAFFDRMAISGSWEYLVVMWVLTVCGIKLLLIFIDCFTLSARIRLKTMREEVENLTR